MVFVMKDCKCGKSFKLNGSLYNHIKNKHNGNYSEFKLSTAKRGRPKKPVNELLNNKKLKEPLYKLEFDPSGNSLVKLFDSGLLASINFRKLMNEFSINHSNLIYERQCVSCNYIRAYNLFNQSTDEKIKRIYIEIVGFVQMLQPNKQQMILDYCLDEIEQTKQPQYNIDQNLQKDLTDILKVIYFPSLKSELDQQNSCSSTTSSDPNPNNKFSCQQPTNNIFNVNKDSHTFKIEYELMQQ